MLAEAPMQGGLARARASAHTFFNLAAAAGQCYLRSDSLASRLALSRYVLKNLAARLWLSPFPQKEISFDFEDLHLSIRPSQGELYLYKEICIDNVYTRHPDFQLRPGWCVLDVGANIGVFALKAARGVRPGRVYAFEPNPQTYPRLLRNLEQNRAWNVSPFPVAIGSSTGTACFDPAAASTLGRILAAGSLPSCVGLDVRVLTLADILQQERISVVDLLKLDVEGAEADALRGAGTSLHKVDRIVMEYHSSELLRECTDLLGSFGFRRVALASPGYAFFSRVS